MKRKLKIKPIYECRCEIYSTLTHWVGRGTGTPEDKDEVNKREVCECEGWVWDLDEIVTLTSRLRLIRKTSALARARPTFPLSFCEKTARRKWNWTRSVCASWTPEVVKKRSVSRWVCKNKSRTNSPCNLTDVLGIGDINDTVFYQQMYH